MLKKSFGFADSDKVVLYSGAIGEKQGLESILDTAKSLRKPGRNKVCDLRLRTIQRKTPGLKESQNLENVIFLPLQPYDKLNSFLNMADIHLVLQKINATDLVMPSKLTAILSIGGLAIITANEESSLHEVVSLYKMGILIEPENPLALTAAINTALINSEGCISKNARSYAEQYLSIDEVFGNLLRIFNNFICRKGF
jgi:colanic acid biosynthesis glycosyl transferase WcaI